MKKNQHPKRALVPTTGAQAFADLHDEIAAVSEELLVPISVDIPYAHEIVFAAADRIDELMPELEKLPSLDMTRIRKLRMYAAACQHAHVLASAPDPVDPRLPRLLEEGAKLRELLLSTAELLVKFGEVSEQRVAAIRSTHGHVEMANGIEQLGVLFAEIWKRVESRVPITRQLVERAPVLSLELHALLGAKKVRPLARHMDPQSMKQRAYTLLVKAYEECQRGVAFLRDREGDADSYTPSFYVKKRRPPTSQQDDVVAEQPVVTMPTPIRVVTELAPTG